MGLHYNFLVAEDGSWRRTVLVTMERLSKKTESRSLEDDIASLRYVGEDKDKKPVYQGEALFVSSVTRERGFY